MHIWPINQGLEVLVLNYCNKVTDVGVIEVISSLSRLSRLELHVSKTGYLFKSFIHKSF